MARARAGASWYRVVAYHKAALTVAGLEAPVAEEVRLGFDLTRPPWIGPKIARQLRQIVGNVAPRQMTFAEVLPRAA